MKRPTQQTGKRSTLKYILACGALPVLAVVLATAWGTACTPEIDEDPYPEIMEFDSETGRILLPTFLAIDQQTGLLNFGPLGIELPQDCTVLSEYEIAACEFYQYLETLDGYPTLTGISAPSSAELDINTVTVPDNLLIMTSTGRILTGAELHVTVDASDLELKIDPLQGWEIGRDYIVAIRGYDTGVRTVDDVRVVAPVTYVMLKAIESLVCGAASPAEIDPECMYYELLLEQLGDPNEAAESLWTLELIRQGLEGQGAWDAAELFGSMPREEVAMLGAFPTHTASVAEVNPALGMIPSVNTTTDMELRVTFKGTIGGNSIVTSTQNPHTASVYLFNLTKLMGGNLVEGMPTMDATWEEPELVISTAAPMIDGDLYGIIMTTRLTNEDGDPIVPSPATVFVRTRGTLLDPNGHSTVSQIDDATAAQAEAGRLQLIQLLDSSTFQTIVGGLEREEIAYLYAFSYPDPLTTD